MCKQCFVVQYKHTLLLLINYYTSLSNQVETDKVSDNVLIYSHIHSVCSLLHTNAAMF